MSQLALNPPALKAPVVDPRIPVHADSCRIGIRLAVHAIKGVFPTPQMIEEILARGAANVALREFPIQSVLSGAVERRRIYATKALEMLMHHSGQDALTMTSEDLDKIVTKAWHVAGAMDRADMTAQQLDTLGT
jgi:allophanate hydrolase subunit 2